MFPAAEPIQAADQLGQRGRLAFVRGRGGLLNGAGGAGVGAKVERPGTRDGVRGMRQDRQAGPPRGGTRGHRHRDIVRGYVLPASRRRVDDQHQVGRVLPDRPPDLLAELGLQLPAEAAIRIAGHRDLGDAQDAGRQLEFPGPHRFQPCGPGGVQRGGLAPGQAQQRETGPGPAEGVQQTA